MNTPTDPSGTLGPAPNRSSDAELTIRLVGFDHPDAQEMCAELQAHYRQLYGGPDTADMTAADFTPPRGSFLVGYLGEAAAVCGGWRLITSERARFAVVTGEVKRLYVRNAFRRRGLADALMTAVEADAARRGVARLVLETGQRQLDAIAFYRDRGYTDTSGRGWAEYCGHAQAVFLGRDLT